MTNDVRDDDQYPDEFAGPDGDGQALEPFDVRDQSSRRGMIWLIGLFVSLLVIAFIVMKLFSSGTRDRDQAPRILANNSPYKEVPLERGGTQTPNQDKAIYESLKGENTPETVNPLDTSEEPIAKPIDMSATNPTGGANVKIKEVVSNIPKPTITKPKIKTPTTNTALPNFNSDYVVQVVSVRSADEARGVWTKLQKKMSGTINGRHVEDIKRVDLGDKGVYYRLRIDGLGSKAAAKTLCERLKAKGQNCIVTKR